MNFRHARPDDTEDVQRVAERTWESDYPNVLNRENVEGVVNEWYDTETVREEMDSEDSIVIVAEDDGKVVGFAHGVWARRTGHILRLYVDPDRRREGTGQELLATIRDSLLQRGSDRIQAMVLAGNDHGNDFYREAGFEKIDEGEAIIGDETYTENVYRRKG